MRQGCKENLHASNVDVGTSPKHVGRDGSCKNDIPIFLHENSQCVVGFTMIHLNFQGPKGVIKKQTETDFATQKCRKQTNLLAQTISTLWLEERPESQQ